MPILIKRVFATSAMLIASLCWEGDTCAQPSRAEHRRAELLVSFPNYCNTPDGMTLDAENNIILSCPNFNDTSSPGILVKIDSNNNASIFYNLPAHPDTKKVGPMGLAFAPSGSLYLADNQYFNDKNRKSRLLRIDFKAGSPQRTVVVASGLALANAVSIRNGYVYVSDTVVDDQADPLISGVYRFKLGDEAIQVRPGKDPHLIATLKTYNKKLRFGADGMCFDSRGSLYVANFGDGTINKLTFSRQGRVLTNRLFVKHPLMKSSDGLFCDVKDNIYVADSLGNAVFAITPKGVLTTITQNGDTDGSDGGLDQPCEVLIRGNSMIVANFDMPFEGCINRTFDRPFTLSRIWLNK